MAERTVIVASRSGLHARPADARSILAVLALRVDHGTTVALSAEGEAADQALDALADLLARALDVGTDG